MKLTQQHKFYSNHPFYYELDSICFLSKNLYNYANYIIRQSIFAGTGYLNYYKILKLVQGTIDYTSLPAKVSQHVLMGLDKNWKSYFQAIKSFTSNPSKFNACPKIPKYHKIESGRNVTSYSNQAISKRSLTKDGLLNPSGTNIFVQTDIPYEKIDQVRIVPKLEHYVVEIVYEKSIVDLRLDQANVAAIDLGLSNLVALTFNKIGTKPMLLSGNPLKSINQFFNKRLAQLQSILKGGSSKRIRRLYNKRGNKISDYLHKASTTIVRTLIENDVGTLVVGKNNGWKQNINIGSKNNQNFVQVPFNDLIAKLHYKCELVGIKFIEQEESYTSKASFLDADSIPTYSAGVTHQFSGRRLQRGMYKAKSGLRLNADINGSYNIMRKAIPNVFSNGIEGLVVHPVRIKTYK
jgi:IS605 OrfB family transposase